MPILYDLLAAIATSTVISGLAVFILQRYFQHQLDLKLAAHQTKLQQESERDLAAYKSELQLATSRDLETHKDELQRESDRDLAAYKDKLQLESSYNLEAHKGNLQREIDTSKMQLENTLSTELFRYQTQFSQSHQKEAEVIEELYGLLSDAFRATQGIASRYITPETHTKERFDETIAKYNVFWDYFQRKRIYIKEDACKKIEALAGEMRGAITGVISSHKEPEQHSEMLNYSIKLVEINAPPIKEALDQQFRSIVTAGTSERKAS